MGYVALTRAIHVPLVRDATARSSGSGHSAKPRRTALCRRPVVARRPARARLTNSGLPHTTRPASARRSELSREPLHPAVCECPLCGKHSRVTQSAAAPTLGSANTWGVLMEGMWQHVVLALLVAVAVVAALVTLGFVGRPDSGA